MHLSTSRPLVSIVTPAYNTARFLVETVESALAQTVSDFEVLIIDDGSTDDTLHVARSLADRDHRIRVITAQNGGAARARNLALPMARGTYVALLDSDDTWAPCHLETQLAALREQPDVAIVTANATNRGGPFDGAPFWPSTTGMRRLTLRDLLAEEDAVFIMSVMRREVIDRIGGFDPRFTGNEDYHFWLRAANVGFVILRNHAPLGWYRRRADSTSADERRMLMGVIAVLREVRGMDGPVVSERRVIHRQLVRFQARLARVEMRESLRQRDLTQAARFLRTLTDLSSAWLLSTAARLTSTRLQALL